MKLLVDTNVVLDLFEKDRPQVEASCLILSYCQLPHFCGYTSVMTIPNVIYILRKKIRSISKQQEIVNAIKGSLLIEEIKASDVTDVFELGFRDYEDGLQAILARRIDADYILTHNVKDFKHSPVPAITPEDFIEKHIATCDYIDNR